MGTRTRVGRGQEEESWIESEQAAHGRSDRIQVDESGSREVQSEGRLGVGEMHQHALGGELRLSRRARQGIIRVLKEEQARRAERLKVREEVAQTVDHLRAPQHRDVLRRDAGARPDVLGYRGGVFAVDVREHQVGVPSGAGKGLPRRVQRADEVPDQRGVSAIARDLGGEVEIGPARGGGSLGGVGRVGARGMIGEPSATQELESVVPVGHAERP